MENEPYDPQFIPPEQHHQCYKANISPYFPRINPYYRHYMPNFNKPWGDVAPDLTYRVNGFDQTYIIEANFPQDTSNLDQGCEILPWCRKKRYKNAIC